MHIKLKFQFSLCMFVNIRFNDSDITCSFSEYAFKISSHITDETESVASGHSDKMVIWNKLYCQVDP